MTRCERSWRIAKVRSRTTRNVRGLRMGEGKSYSRKSGDGMKQRPKTEARGWFLKKGEGRRCREGRERGREGLGSCEKGIKSKIS